MGVGVLFFGFIERGNATPINTFSLVKIIELNPLVGDDGSIEVDVVGDELYVAKRILGICIFSLHERPNLGLAGTESHGFHEKAGLPLYRWAL